MTSRVFRHGESALCRKVFQDRDPSVRLLVEQAVHQSATSPQQIKCYTTNRTDGVRALRRHVPLALSNWAVLQIIVNRRIIIQQRRKFIYRRSPMVTERNAVTDLRMQ